MITTEGKTSDFGVCNECHSNWSTGQNRAMPVRRITLADHGQFVLCQLCCDKLVKLVSTQAKKITQGRLRRALDKAGGAS